MQLRIKKIIIVIGLMLIARSWAKAQTWVKENIIISTTYSDPTLLNKANVNAFICDENGNPDRSGFFVMLDNKSDYPLFYRTAVGAGDHYEPIKSRNSITWSPANVLTYFKVSPHEKSIITAGGFYSKRELTLPKNMVAEFKYFKRKGQQNSKTDSDGNLLVQEIKAETYFMYS